MSQSGSSHSKLLSSRPGQIDHPSFIDEVAPVGNSNHYRPFVIPVHHSDQ